EKSEVRSWDNGEVRTVIRFADEYRPRYPHDDVWFSADGERMTLTRYSLDGKLQRFAIVTRTGEVTSLGTDDAKYTEWSPERAALLVRFADRLELRDLGSAATATVPIGPGTVHTWSPDGKSLLVGRVSPTVPAGNAFDPFRAVTGPATGTTYLLPNVMGSRT